MAIKDSRKKSKKSKKSKKKDNHLNLQLIPTKMVVV